MITEKKLLIQNRNQIYTTELGLQRIR